MILRLPKSSNIWNDHNYDYSTEVFNQGFGLTRLNSNITKLILMKAHSMYYNFVKNYNFVLDKNSF